MLYWSLNEMNRITYHIALALVLLETACSKETAVVKGPIPSDMPIEFGVPQTKGAPQLTTLERLAAQDFSVSAWYTPEGETFSPGSVLYIENRRFGTLDNVNYSLWQSISREGGLAADPVYYPLDGSLTFFCYAPYRADVSNASDVQLIYEPESSITSQLSNYMAGSPLICFTPSESPSNQIDFIASVPQLDAVRSEGAVELDFTHHLTTDVQFWVKYLGTVNEGEGVMISQIVIRDVIGSEYLYFTDSFGVPGYSWNSTISPNGGVTMPVSSYVLRSSTNELISENAYLESSTPKYVNETINGRLYLLPQTLPSGAYLDITYVVKNVSSGAIMDENTVSCSLYGTTAWPIGKTVKYTITIGVADRKDVTLEANILDWQDSGNTHSVQELLY